MTEAELIKFIRQVVREEFAPVAMATIVANATQLRSTFQRTSSDSRFPNARSIQPYGYASRAPTGTECLAVPVGGNASHVNIVGHFDSARPLVSDGETLLYDANGHAVYLSTTKVQIGTMIASHPVPLGDILKTALNDLLEAIISHQHMGNLGYPTGTPMNSSAFSAIKSSPVGDDSMNSSLVFTE
jgi:hypothetical protein